MAALSIQVPYPVFYDRDGQPIDNGNIYIGVANLDPVTNPIQVYYDAALTITASQPLKTSNGYIYRNGTPTQLYVNAGNFSITVRNSDDTLVYNFPDGSGIGAGASSIAFTGFKGQVGTVADLADADGSDWIGFTPSGSGAVARSSQDKNRDTVSVKDFGAVGNGIANDSAAFTAASATGKKVLVPAGDYLIGTSISVASQIEFVQGSKILVGNGIVVTFNGTLSAGVYRIFQCTGTGEIVLNWRYTSEAYPEWWGAASDGATDCLAAIQASLKAAQTTKLHPGDYFVSNTVKIIYDHRWLVGSGSRYAGVNNKVTRLLVTNGSSYTLQVGPDAEPATINDFQKQNIVRDIHISRTVAPVIAANSSGVSCQYTLFAELHGVDSAEHIAGFRFAGNVYLKCYDCSSSRASAGTGSGTDSWYGFYYDGSIDIGAAGGNASIYTNYCNASCNLVALQTGVSYGFYANAAFTDLFFESPETVSCNTAMYIEGNGPVGTVPSNLDLQIKNPIHDSFKSVGTHFKNINQYGSAALINGYHGGAIAATHFILIEDCIGSIFITGGQMPMVVSSNATGIGIGGSKGVVVDRTQILEAEEYGVVLVNSSSCDIRPIVKNFNTPLNQAAVTLTGSTRNTVAPIVYGAAGYVLQGINAAGSGNLYNEFNCTGIDSVTVGGSADKLIINGTPVTTTGLSGTNLVSGVMA
jgi:hypothetical protein